VGTLSGLVWLFKEHRDMNLVNQSLLRDMDARDRQIAALEAALAIANRRAATPDSVLNDLTGSAFAEVPFEGGKIPEGLWLTPPPEDTN